MTALTGTLAQIESSVFCAEMNLAAGKKLFLRFLRSNPVFIELCEAAHNPEGTRQIKSRLLDLVRTETQSEHEHPYDVALAAYLLALDDTAEPDIIAEAAREMAGLPNGTWSTMLAREILLRATSTGQLNHPTTQAQAEAPVNLIRPGALNPWHGYLYQTSIPSQVRISYTPPLPPSHQIPVPQQLPGKADIPGAAPRGRNRTIHRPRPSSPARRGERRSTYA